MFFKGLYIMFKKKFLILDALSFVLVSLTQLIVTVYNIYEVRDSNLGHHQKVRCTLIFMHKNKLGRH